jgi:hypothetical protein
MACTSSCSCRSKRHRKAVRSVLCDCPCPHRMAIIRACVRHEAGSAAAAAAPSGRSGGGTENGGGIFSAERAVATCTATRACTSACARTRASVCARVVCARVVCARALCARVRLPPAEAYVRQRRRERRLHSSVPACERVRARARECRPTILDGLVLENNGVAENLSFVHNLLPVLYAHAHTCVCARVETRDYTCTDTHTRARPQKITASAYMALTLGRWQSKQTTTIARGPVARLLEV